MSVILLTPDGSRVQHEGVELRQCPLDATNGKILYCSREGKFYSRKQTAEGATEMREVKYCFNPGMQHHKGGSAYPKMRQFNNQLCHKLIALTWIGQRPQGYEIDHINGDIMNWSADNLEYVTPEENRKRAKILHAMRKAGNDPKQYPPARLKAIFSKYELMK